MTHNPKHFVEFDLEGGGTVLVEVEGRPPPGEQRVSRGGEVIHKPSSRLSLVYALSPMRYSFNFVNSKHAG